MCPLYSFESPEGQLTDIFFTMKDAPKLGSTVEMDGEKWKRIPTTSQLATAGIKPIDPHSSKAFVEKTGRMNGTIGEMWDYSKEQSEKRAAQTGEDPIKKKYLENYSKARKGKPNLTALREQQQANMKVANEKLKKAGIEISLA